MGHYKTSAQNVLYGNEEYIKTHTRQEIMEKFNVSYDTISNFCTKNRIKPVHSRSRDKMPDDFAEYAKEHTIWEICEHFDFNYAFVCKYLRRNNLPHKVNRIRGFNGSKKSSMKRTGEAKDMIKVLTKTFTDAAIARVFGCSKERIRQIRMEIIKQENSWMEENNKEYGKDKAVLLNAQLG